MGWTGGGACVLIADDDPEVCDLLSSRLNELGIKTVTSAEGFEASKYVENQKFSVIVLDLNLPIIKGMQIATRARNSKANRQTPIYIISGYLKKDTLVQSRTLGINGVFAKPFALNDLIPKIIDAIDPKDRPVDYDPRIIKCFVAGAVEVLKFYFSDEEPKIGSPTIRQPATPRNLYASAVIPINSKQFTGSMSLGLPVTFIKKWISKMFDDPAFKIDNEVIGSTTGELCNQMLGIVSSHFEKIGILAENGTPSLEIGKGHRIKHALNNSPIVIPIQFGDAGIELEFCLSKNASGDPIAVGRTGAEDDSAPVLEMED